MYWASVTIMQQGRNSAATFGHLLEDIKLFCSEFDLVIFYMFVQVLIVWLIVEPLLLRLILRFQVWLEDNPSTFVTTLAADVISYVYK